MLDQQEDSPLPPLPPPSVHRLLDAQADQLSDFFPSLFPSVSGTKGPGSSHGWRLIQGGFLPPSLLPRFAAFDRFPAEKESRKEKGLPPPAGVSRFGQTNYDTEIAASPFSLSYCCSQAVLNVKKMERVAFFPPPLFSLKQVFILGCLIIGDGLSTPFS